MDRDRMAVQPAPGWFFGRRLALDMRETDEDDPPDPGPEGFVEEIAEIVRIGRMEEFLGVGPEEHPGEMDDGVTLPQMPAEGFGTPQIDLAGLDTGAGRQVVGNRPAVPEKPQRDPVAGHLPRQQRSQIPGRAGNDYPFHIADEYTKKIVLAF